MITEKDKALLRELAGEYAELAALPVNGERVRRIRNVNSLRPDRPPVWINEIPWHEMDIDGQLLLRCGDPFAREMERFFRRKLFRWSYFQADMVLEPCYYIDKTWTTTGTGIEIVEETVSTDDRNNIVSHNYEDQLDTEEKLQRLQLPVITANKAEDEARAAMAAEILDGILPVKLRGTCIYYCPWDDISMRRGMEAILMDTVLNPELLHKTIRKYQEIGLAQMTQLEAQGLLDYNLASLHCTPPWTDDLPSGGFDGENVGLKDVWLRAMAQPFASVSPEVHEAFDIAYLKPLAERCGLVYYGCCEPLHDRMGMLKKIPNMRKIGVSPWSDVRRSAEEMGGNYVFARKPNPALVSGVADSEVIRAEIRESILACRENGCAYEFVLKDISTVSGRPGNLIEWNRAVQETIDEYY